MGSSKEGQPISNYLQTSGMRFFLDTKCFFAGYKKLFLAFWKVKSGKGGVPRSATQKRQQKQQKAQNNKKISTNNRSRTSRSKLHKQWRAPNSSNTWKKAPKGSAKAAKEAARAAQTWKTAAQTAAKAAQTAAKTAQKQQQRHEGPEGRRSLCSHWRLLVEFRFFQAFLRYQWIL